VAGRRDGKNNSSSCAMPAGSAWYGSHAGWGSFAPAAADSTVQPNTNSSSGSLPHSAVRNNVRKQLLSFNTPTSCCNL